jgi:hypothetical protein
MEGNILVHLFLNGTVLSNLVKHDQQRFNKRLVHYDFSNLKMSKIKRLASVNQRDRNNEMERTVLSHRDETRAICPHVRELLSWKLHNVMRCPTRTVFSQSHNNHPQRG